MAKEPLYEPIVPFRWHCRHREVSSGRTRADMPIAGGGTRTYTETYKVLQWWNDDLEQWVDVPDVQDS